MHFCHHEETWIQNCPIEFKPVLYKRYVDDRFLLFEHESHINKFHNYINKQHDRIDFTFETEKNNLLPFLDVLVTKELHGFSTSTYRKPSHTGLGMKFDSSIPNKYKLNLIDCLVDRAYKINSTVYGLMKDIFKIKQFFAQNRFNQFLINKRVADKLHSIKNPKAEVITVPKRVVYATLPYMTEKCNSSLQRSISCLVKEFLPQINLRLCFKNNFTTSSLLNFKDRIPDAVRSNIVYRYKCGMCNSMYIGETSRHYTTRVAEHMGVSPRTGAPMAKVNSNIYSHFIETGHRIKQQNFTILYNRDNKDLKYSESIAIHQLGPNLNEKTYSVPLEILCQ